MKRFWTTLGLAIALGSGIYVIGTVSGSAPSADTGNIWYAVGGNGTNCVRSASLVADPNPATDCATMDAAYDLASAGDTIKVTCQSGSSTCSDGSQVITGTHTSTGCNTSTEAGCITFVPAQGKSVALSTITLTGDYIKLKDLAASDSNLTVNGSLNLQTPTCTTQNEVHDEIVENVSMSQLGIFGGLNNIWVKNSDVSGRRNDASQWFPCSFDATSPRPKDVLVENTNFHDYHMTFPNSCANGGGFTYTTPVATVSSTGGTISGGQTIGYTVRAGFRQVGDGFMTSSASGLACMFPQVNVVIPAGTNTNKVTLTWVDPNPAWTYLAGYDVYGRSTTQASETKLKTFYPASYASASQRIVSLSNGFSNCDGGGSLNCWIDDGSSNVGGSPTNPSNLGDVHMECIHIDGFENLTIRNSKFWNCGEYDISFSQGGGSNNSCTTNWFHGTLNVEGNFFGAAAGGNDVIGGPGVISELQYDPACGTTKFRFNTLAGTKGVQVSSNGYATDSWYGNIWNTSISSFSCSFQSAREQYDIWLNGGVACGTNSQMVSSLPFVSAAGLPPDLHLTSCSGAWANLVPTTITGGYPSTDLDGDSRPKGGGAGTLVDAGADETCT